MYVCVISWIVFEYIGDDGVGFFFQVEIFGQLWCDVLWFYVDLVMYYLVVVDDGFYDGFGGGYWDCKVDFQVVVGV